MTAATVKPVFFHNYPVAMYEELLKAFSIKAVIDLTPGEGNLAFAAFRRNVIYTGITFSEEHSDGLMARIDKCVLQDMV